MGKLSLVNRDIGVSWLNDDVASFAVIDGVQYGLVSLLRPFVCHEGV
jgi:hypothetical protein